MSDRKFHVHKFCESDQTGGRYAEFCVCDEHNNDAAAVCDPETREPSEELARLFAASEKLLAACEKALMNGMRWGRCVFCEASVNDEHTADCLTRPLRSAIRAAREGE